MRYINQKNRSILREMISSDFKVRYQGSVLGYLWSLLRPMFMFAILYVVFTFIFKVGKGVDHYPVYLLLGIVLWNFFTETTVVGISAIVSHGDLIRKISIPRYIVVLSTTAAAFINLLLNLLVVIIVALITGIEPSLGWLLFPLLIVELLVFSLAVALLLSALYVRFRDIVYIWEVFVQAAFYATPIVYPLTFVPERFREYFFVNPMAQIVQDSRWLLVTHQSVTVWGVTSRVLIGAIPLSIVVLAIIIARWYFRRQAKTFAEYL